MRRPGYLNLDQAKAITSDHLHWIGRPFDPSNPESGAIRDVIIAPHNKIMQWQYVRCWRNQLPANDLFHGRYNVLVISDQIVRKCDPQFYCTLKTYAEKHGLPFSMTRYNHLMKYY